MSRKVVMSVAGFGLAFGAMGAGSAVAIPDSSAPAKSKKTKIKVETPKTDMFAYFEKRRGELRPMPKELRAGTYVFTYVNNTSMQHDLKVGAAKTKICSNCTKKVQVKLTKGKVKYKCTVPGHAQGGMKGKIKVT